MSELWRRCLERLESELSVEDMHTYLMPLQASEDAEGLRLLAPNAYTLDFVKAEFLPRIGKVLNHLNGAPLKLRMADSKTIAFVIAGLRPRSVISTTSPRNCCTSKNFATGTISRVPELMRSGEKIP